MSMVTRKTWAEFRAAGLLWWINRILHTFGWAIVVVTDDQGNVDDVYPAHVRFRGFDESTESEGFGAVAQFVRYDNDQLEG